MSLKLRILQDSPIGRQTQTGLSLVALTARQLYVPTGHSDVFHGKSQATAGGSVQCPEAKEGADNGWTLQEGAWRCM